MIIYSCDQFIVVLILCFYSVFILIQKHGST